MSGAVAPRGIVPPALITVVIADDHAVVRDGLRALVEAQPGLQVIGEAANGHEAWQRACELKPNVLLLDLTMPGFGGTEAAERIAKDCPTVRMLVLTMHEERGYVTRVLRAGAAGYVLKRSAAGDLVRAIRAVASGNTYVDPSLAGALLTEQSSRATQHATDRITVDSGGRASELTAREAETLRLVARGYSNKEIANALEIGVKTVETHKANGLAKLGLATRAGLVRFAMDAGWLTESGGG